MGAGLCGSGLAREGSVSVSTSESDTPLSRASPLPHGLLQRTKISIDLHQSPLWRLASAPAKPCLHSTATTESKR
ncbi:hypothetical protein DBR46_07525 [Pseudomonas sp. KBW05]|nr:hypothetical protein DBR46_07525 [Pseudomonas sp. KBW05]